jgi:outer membrane lipoprotein-sorting protein
MRLILPILLSVFATARAESLAQALARLDKSADAFQAMTANLSQVEHTEVINQDETRTATVRMKRTRQGIAGRVDFTGPNRMTVSIRNRQVQRYSPQGNVVELYDVGKYGDQLDQFLLLGFSTSGKELRRNYNLRLVGTEKVGGKVTTHIELTPKSKEAQEIFKKADIWLAQDATYPVKEKIHKNDQDYTLITYSDVQLNPPLSDKDLELNLPPGVQKITPQK